MARSSVRYLYSQTAKQTFTRNSDVAYFDGKKLCRLPLLSGGKTNNQIRQRRGILRWQEVVSSSFTLRRQSKPSHQTATWHTSMARSCVPLVHLRQQKQIQPPGNGMAHFDGKKMCTVALPPGGESYQTFCASKWHIRWQEIVTCSLTRGGEDHTTLKLGDIQPNTLRSSNRRRHSMQ